MFNSIYKTMKLFLLFLSLSLTSQSFAQTKTDRQEMNLKGKVKSVIENRCMATISDGSDDSDYDPMKVPRDIITMKFNLTGNLTQYGSDYSTNKYTYNATGKLIQNCATDPNGDTSFRWIYKYDSKKNNTEIERYGSSKLEGKMVMKYDIKGNMIEEKRFDEEGKLEEINTFIYDAGNHKIEETTTNTEGKVYRKISYKYDALGNNIEYLSENTKVLYSYDKNKNMIKMSVSYNGDQTPRETVFTYEYDSQNNWTKETTSDNIKVNCIATRKYEYYK